MKRILLTACGGPATLGYSRSLRDADPAGTEYYIVGTDCDEFNMQRAEMNRSYLCPPANDPRYLPYLLEIIRREKIDFMHSQAEIEAFVIGKNRARIMAAGCRLLMPDQESMELLRDKWRSYEVWQKAGIKVPENVALNSEDDLKTAYDRFGNDIWIRETVGAAGKGSLSRPTYSMALTHIQTRKMWGHAVAARHLTSDTVTWQSLWHEGKLVVAQGRRRLSWAFGNRAQSGVTGLTGTGITVNEPGLDALALKCILAADPRPHGVFSVDFTQDQDGVPNPTEINIGKFFTTHHFLTRTGCNMPHIMVQLAFATYRGPYGIMNPCRPDMYWIRGIDVAPVLVHKSDIDGKKEEYDLIVRGIHAE